MNKKTQNIRINGWELKKLMEENCICPISVGRRFNLCDSYVRIGCNRGTMRQDVYDFILSLVNIRCPNLTDDFPCDGNGATEYTADTNYGIHIRFDEQGKPVVTITPEGGVSHA